MDTFLDRYHKRNPQRATVMGLIRMSDGDCDQWGTYMGWFFGIADVLWHYSADEIPPEWEYRHSPVCERVDMDSWPDSELAELVRDGVIGTDALMYAGQVVERYTRWLDRAGLSY